jgi:hypothetical protein
MWKMLCVTAASAVFGACALDGPTQVDADRSESTRGHDRGDVAREVVLLYEELAARLYERGVTPEQMQAAVEDGDAERVRELFGYARAEYDARNARLLLLASMAQAAGGGAASLDGLECEWEILECGAGFLLSALGLPHLGLGILVSGAVICSLSDCRWRDGAGPRTKPP